MIAEQPYIDQSIAFIDAEIEPKTEKVLDLGAVKGDGNRFHKASMAEFTQFLKGTKYICGHNIFNHDLKYIGNAVNDANINAINTIDTLFFSPLLFPTRLYHSLVKDDKLQSEAPNSPLNDSINARDLFNEEIAAFAQTEDTLKQIFYLLLNGKKEFCGFFRFISYTIINADLEKLILQKFKNEICEHADLSIIISTHPIALAYCLSMLNAFVCDKNNRLITPLWVLKNYPEVESIMFRLRNKPCGSGCVYCNNTLDIYKGLKQFFDFDSFRTYGDELLQEKAVKAAIDNESLIAVFPTGGGKSITFQVPALMSGESLNGLTVVISPLQSLMKDQVDNLVNAGIIGAVTIGGLPKISERRKSIRSVEDGSASILYVSPESLRSKTVERLILGRKIVRFVIDEAHCFSSWGQDFRVDYLYIGDFIKSIQEKKKLEYGIPVSCFTATAKRKVIEDIQDYFKEKLSLDLQLFTSKVSRTNLTYKVFEKVDDEEKYQTVRDLIEEKNCPTIIYVSKTRKAYLLALRLVKEGFNAKPYHGKMDKEDKSQNQDSFIKGETQIIVATSAFGMGVDKKDVGMVIHYEISDSLENYIQEAGRAGRNEETTADCFLLFNEEDLAKHFFLLNQRKLSIKEIQQVWKAIKSITKSHSRVSNSPLEIARKAGWGDNVAEIETRVITAIAALEDAGYLKRGQNMPRVFANSILSKNAQEAIGKINLSERFSTEQKINAIRIIKKLFSSKSRRYLNEETPESRIDYISDHLGIIKGEVIKIVNLLRDEGILADAQDLTAFVKNGENKNRSSSILDAFSRIENFLLPIFDEQSKIYNIKELNEGAEKNGCEDVDSNKIKTIINFWAINRWIKRKTLKYSKNHVKVRYVTPNELSKEKLEKRHELARFIVAFLYEKSILTIAKGDSDKVEVLVEFSIQELKTAYETGINRRLNIDVNDIEDTLFYLSSIEVIKIEGNFLVVYNGLAIERTELDNKKNYTKDDYQKLQQFYENRIQQIHIVGEYANKMINDYKSALQFVDDYFKLKNSLFLNKYFDVERQSEIKLNLTQSKYNQLFGDLSLMQREIVKDSHTQYVVIAAGPGSGKTKVLVHKLASLLLTEDVKHEQLLMITFSRAAVTEFKKRLFKLIGNAASYIEITTFHSYCFDLLGKVGSLELSDVILKKTIAAIENGDVETSRITKTVLVIDEAQDMNHDEFNLIKALMQHNEGMKVIAVGDDDQNIYEFRGASSKYLEEFTLKYSDVKYELVENYRSKRNLVEFANQFVKRIGHRLKETPIIAKQTDNGNIKVVRYKSGNLIVPLVHHILTTGLTGTTCVLTKTNEEGLQVKALLLKNNRHAKLVQTNEGFNLYNLSEVRFFFSQLNLENGVFLISDSIWENAKRELINKFRNSTKLEVCKNIIKDFEATNPKRKYKSDFEVFIRESRLEDFFGENGDTIFVSTIHKAKGKEFDNVFLLLDNFSLTTDESKRQLYVAITRAKKNLTIHLNSNYFDVLSVDNLVQVEDSRFYFAPKEHIIQLNHENVNLGYSEYIQHRIGDMISGDPLVIKEDGCANSNDDLVLKFSKKFLETLEAEKSNGYVLKSAMVNYIVYWLKEGAEQEVKIILPELCFEKE